MVHFDDFIYFAQFLMLLTNITVFVFLMQEKTKLKLLKLCLLTAVSIGTVINLGTTNFIIVLFSVVPFFLIKNIGNKESNNNTM